MNKELENVVIETIKDYFNKSSIMKKYNNVIISQMSNKQIINFMNKFLKEDWKNWIDWLKKDKKDDISLIIKEARRASDYIDEMIWQDEKSYIF